MTLATRPNARREFAKTREDELTIEVRERPDGHWVCACRANGELIATLDGPIALRWKADMVAATTIEAWGLTKEEKYVRPISADRRRERHGCRLDQLHQLV